MGEDYYRVLQEVMLKVEKTPEDFNLYQEANDLTQKCGLFFDEIGSFILVELAESLSNCLNTLCEQKTKPGKKLFNAIFDAIHELGRGEESDQTRNVIRRIKDWNENSNVGSKGQEKPSQKATLPFELELENLPFPTEAEENNDFGGGLDGSDPFAFGEDSPFADLDPEINRQLLNDFFAEVERKS